MLAFTNDLSASSSHTTSSSKKAITRCLVSEGKRCFIQSIDALSSAFNFLEQTYSQATVFIKTTAFSIYCNATLALEKEVHVSEEVEKKTNTWLESLSHSSSDIRAAYSAIQRVVNVHRSYQRNNNSVTLQDSYKQVAARAIVSIINLEAIRSGAKLSTAEVKTITALAKRIIR